jgi:protein FRA10AC1
MSASSSDSSLSSSHKRRDRKEPKKKRHPTNQAAPSDYAQLRQHFQFVLPDNKYGSTWQERMVQHYHSHLYKEYVLADLSRVLTGKNGRGGPVGLRWRTADEVKDGKGFQTCGNLACCHANKADDEYTRRVRSALGVGVAENGGSIPLGVVLPSEEGSSAIEKYLQSCEREERKSTKKEQKRKRRKVSKSKRDDDEYLSNKQEAKEQKRISRLSYGLGLHDYEVDFAYVEQNQKKRELVKVRLCLRCAPLIFDGWAIKARLAREKAARQVIGDSLGDSVNGASVQDGGRRESSGQVKVEPRRSDSFSSSSDGQSCQSSEE